MKEQEVSEKFNLIKGSLRSPLWDDTTWKRPETHDGMRPCQYPRDTAGHSTGKAGMFRYKYEEPRECDEE